MIATSGSEHEGDADISRFEVPKEEKQHGVELFGGSENAMRWVGIVTMLFVAANDATINVLARTMRELHFSLLCFWFSAIGCTFLILYLIIACIVKGDWPDMVYYSAQQAVYILMTGVCSAFNLTCLTIAYQNDSSATVALIAYIALVYAFLADVLIFELSFVAMELIGAGVITFFNLFTIWFKMYYVDDEEVENDEAYQSIQNE